VRRSAWEKGHMIDLRPLPGGYACGAAAINERGDVVGKSAIASQPSHVVLWTRHPAFDAGRRVREDQRR